MIKILETTLPQPNVVSTWAQAPLYLDDALERTIIISSEYDVEITVDAALGLGQEFDNV